MGTAAVGAATRSCTTPSTTTPGSPTPEILADERKETAAAFWRRADAFFAAAGVTVAAVMTDNGSCYRSHAFAAAPGTPAPLCSGQPPAERVHNLTGNYS